MAVNGWVKSGKDAFRKGEDLLEIHSNKTKTMPNQKKWKYSFDVAVYDSHLNNKTSSAIFLKKSEAISFAKKYMRSH